MDRFKFCSTCLQYFKLEYEGIGSVMNELS